MPWHDDLHAHFRGAPKDSVKIIDLEPEQHAVSVRLVISVADGPVIVVRFEAVELKDQFAIEDQTLIHGSAVIASAAEETLIPPTAGFHVGYGDERLRTHCDQRSNVRRPHRPDEPNPPSPRIDSDNSSCSTHSTAS